MAVTEAVAALGILSTATLRLPDLRSIKQRGHDRRRSDSYRDPCLDQLGPPFLVTLVGIAHSILVSGGWPRPYAQRGRLKREHSCGVA